MLQPGHELLSDLLGQLFDRLACVENLPSPRLLGDQLLVAGRNLLVVGQLARVEPVPFDRVGARRLGARWRGGLAVCISLLSGRPVAWSPYRPVTLPLAPLALQALL